MHGMSSIETAVADSPPEDYQAIGQAAKKQVPWVMHCITLRWVAWVVWGICSGSRGAEANLMGESEGNK